MSIYHTHTSFGGEGELIAKRYLAKQGFLFIEANFKTRDGEIDLIMKKNGTLYFIEVKTRRSELSGFPEEAVSARKLEKMRRAIAAYRPRKQDSNCSRDILVVSILYRYDSATEISMFYVE